MNVHRILEGLALEQETINYAYIFGLIPIGLVI